MASRSPRGRGQLEHDVLACVIAADRPVTAADVQAELGGGLAYTTVMTTLARLERKNVLVRELRGKAFAYRMRGEATDVQASLAAHRMRRVLDAREDRAGVLARFVADLSSEDEEVLVRLLAERASAQP